MYDLDKQIKEIEDKRLAKNAILRSILLLKQYEQYPEIRDAIFGLRVQAKEMEKLGEF